MKFHRPLIFSATRVQALSVRPVFRRNFIEPIEHCDELSHNIKTWLHVFYRRVVTSDETMTFAKGTFYSFIKTFEQLCTVVRVYYIHSDTSVANVMKTRWWDELVFETPPGQCNIRVCRPYRKCTGSLRSFNCIIWLVLQ